jgi:hypothetical protein
MTQAERIVSVLLEEEPEEFMRDVSFDPAHGGEMVVMHNLDLVRDELDDLKNAVIRRTAEIAPKLVERGIIQPNQTAILAKLITFYLADQQYNPKHWHETWQKAAKKIWRWLPANVGWSSSRSNLRDR